MTRASLPTRCVHGSGPPARCSQCIGATNVRRVQVDYERHIVLVDGQVVRRSVAPRDADESWQVKQPTIGRRRGLR